MLKNQLPTPSVIVDLQILQQNIQGMADRAKEHQVALRPHIKTHKTVEIAKMQLAAGAIGITCAKVSEAQVMYENGIRDILIAYPTVGDKQVSQAMELAQDCRLILAIDSEFGAKKINYHAKQAGLVIECYLIVNTGGNRDGVLPGEPGRDLANQVARYPHIKLSGLMTHEGHVYKKASRSAVSTLAEKAWQDMLETKRLLNEGGHDIQEVSIGSTPTCLAGKPVPGISQWRPGTYVFNDVQEMNLVTTQQECALKVLSTVVSHPAPDRYILDAGAKSLTLSSLPEYGHGLIEQAPSARIVSLSEEHGVVSALDGELEIGQRVEIIPIHVCPVVNLTDQLYITVGEEVVDIWQVAARGKVV